MVKTAFTALLANLWLVILVASLSLNVAFARMSRVPQEPRNLLKN